MKLSRRLTVFKKNRPDNNVYKQAISNAITACFFPFARRQSANRKSKLAFKIVSHNHFPFLSLNRFEESLGVK